MQAVYSRPAWAGGRGIPSAGRPSVSGPDLSPPAAPRDGGLSHPCPPSENPAMRIDVIGKHLEITPAIQVYAEKKADKLTKYFNGTQQIRVYVEAPQGRASEFHAEIVVEVVKHDDFVAKAVGPDLYAAIDAATEKAQRQIRDFKDKLRS